MTDPVEPGAETNMRPLRDTLSQLRLRELLMEVQDRVEQIMQGRDRLDGLVEAMLVVTSGLELDGTLRTIVHTAIELVDAITVRWACAATITNWSSSSTRASTKRCTKGSGISRRVAASSAC